MLSEAGYTVPRSAHFPTTGWSRLHIRLSSADWKSPEPETDFSGYGRLYSLTAWIVYSPRQHSIDSMVGLILLLIHWPILWRAFHFHSRRIGIDFSERVFRHHRRLIVPSVDVRHSDVGRSFDAEVHLDERSAAGERRAEWLAHAEELTGATLDAEAHFDAGVRLDVRHVAGVPDAMNLSGPLFYPQQKRESTGPKPKGLPR